MSGHASYPRTLLNGTERFGELVTQLSGGNLALLELGKLILNLNLLPMISGNLSGWKGIGIPRNFHSPRFFT